MLQNLAQGLVLSQFFDARVQGGGGEEGVEEVQGLVLHSGVLHYLHYFLKVETKVLFQVVPEKYLGVAFLICL